MFIQFRNKTKKIPCYFLAYHETGDAVCLIYDDRDEKCKNYKCWENEINNT